MRNGTMVRDVMHREFLGVSESDTLGDAASLMLQDGADCLVVLRGGEPVGCLTPRTALGALLNGSDPTTTPVSDVMSPPAPTVDADDSVTTAEERLVSEGTSQLVVTNAGEAVGVLTERDVLAASTTHSAVAAGDGGTSESVTASPASPATMGDESEGLTQAICELCGSLVSNLTATNGELVCADCQEV